MAQGRLHHGLGSRMAVFCQELLFQGTGIDADADRHLPLSGGLHHLRHLPSFADVAGIEAQPVNPLSRTLRASL